jgi:hypothetical protein
MWLGEELMERAFSNHVVRKEGDEKVGRPDG